MILKKKRPLSLTFYCNVNTVNNYVHTKYVQLGGQITKYIRYRCRVNYHHRSREEAKKRFFIFICHAQTRQIIYLKENKPYSGPTVKPPTK